MRTAAIAAALVLSTLAVAAADLDPASEYRKLQQWRFAATGQTVPSEGLKFSRDTATWTLQSGEIRFMEPALDGRVTGFVFEGKGRFEMAVPDPVEMTQLRRFSGKADLERIDVPFSSLVVRSSEDVLPPPAAGTFAENDAARKRHEHWLIDLGLDADARVVASVLNRQPYFVAGMKTDGMQTLIWEYDPLRQEEIHLLRWHASYTESWISLDRVEDRTAAGRPGLRESEQIRLDHVNAKVDLTDYSRTGRVGDSGQRTFAGQYTIEETWTALADGISALRLSIDSTARDLEAADEDGTPLLVLRDHIGKRSASVGNDIWDSDLVVILPEPMKKGDKRRITFRFVYETANYAPGDAWYPTVVQGLPESGYTARIEVTVPKRHEVRSMGKLDKSHEDEKTRTSAWIVEKPVKMLTFSTADRVEEVKIDVEGIPQVISFGSKFQRDNRDKVRNVGVDVANSLKFFEYMLEDEIGGERIYATNIAAGHGQAFDGFLHMSEFEFTGEHPGASELFRAHEVAHTWFGHKIGWKSYRDQWLSEAFAEYCAMFFVKTMVKDGDRYFEEILNSYEGIVKGNLQGGFSKFNRPWLIEFNNSSQRRLGPIGLGYRAGTSDIPFGYLIQTYHKGPLVLHMLRTFLLYRTGNDDVFIKTLRDFVDEYSGKAASTDDFRRILERNTKGNWASFFSSWIDGAEIPSYTWKYRVEGDGEEMKIILNVKRSGVGDDFVTPVAVRLDFPQKKTATFFFVSKEKEQTITQKIPTRPSEVVFAPDHSLLAHIRRD